MEPSEFADYTARVTRLVDSLNRPLSVTTSKMGVNEITITASGAGLSDMKANADAAEEALLAAGIPARRFSVSHLYIADFAR